MNPLWSIFLAAVGITGLWLAGRNNKLGWAIGLFAQALWLTYGIATRQPGFIVTAFAYAFVYGRNWWRWKKAEGLVVVTPTAAEPTDLTKSLEEMYAAAPQWQRDAWDSLIRGRWQRDG